MRQPNPRSPFELESEPTEILSKAETFVNLLIAIVARWGQRQGPCPRCKSDFVKRHGTRARKIRGHRGRQVIQVQRWRCCVCRKTWSEPIPGVAPFMRYSRAVIRKTLDMYVFGVGSLRIVAQMLRSEINGTERARHWDPEGLEWPELPEHRKIRLSHTSVWRWLQEAGRRANKDALDKYLNGRGVVLDPFSGVGTTIVEAILSGHSAVGFEISPYAALACQTKVNAHSVDVGAFDEEAKRFREF